MEPFKMKIALYQGAGKPAGVDENLAAIEHQALAAAEQGADLIIFPELFLTGYNIGPTVQELAQEADGPASRRALARINRFGTPVHRRCSAPSISLRS